MEYWEAYESTILVQTYFHLKAFSPLTNKHSIAGKPLTKNALKCQYDIPYIYILYCDNKNKIPP